jgi:hypothetical protein
MRNTEHLMLLTWPTVAGEHRREIDHGGVHPLHVATWIEIQTNAASAPTVKQALAAIRHLFDRLVTGQIVPVNPAASVPGRQQIVRQGKTPVLEPAEARLLALKQ